jgi:predicted nucleic acid-binding protein
VLIDDRKAFNEAKALGLMPISTRAILQVAAQREIINDLAELESQLQTKQFFSAALLKNRIVMR